MAEIHVVFPEDGEPLVYNLSTAVLKDEHIFWHIHNENPLVKKVKIAFEANGGPAANFFPTSSGPLSEITKDLTKRTFIWGISPHTMGSGHKKDKYSIFGLKANGDDVPDAFVDPTILSDDP